MNTTSLKQNAIDLSRRFGVLITGVLLSSYAVYCDAFTTAETIVSKTSSSLTSLAQKIFPLALIIVIIMIIMTRDERKLAMEIKVLLGICAGYILLLMLNNGVFQETLEGLSGLGGGISGHSNG